MSSRIRAALVRAAICVSVGAIAVAVDACGARGPLDFELYAGADSSTDASTSGDGALVDAADAVAPKDVIADVRRDSSDSGSPINCGTCIASQCGGLLTQCMANPQCLTVLQCVLFNCAAGGTPNQQCLLGCAAASPSGAIQAFGVFQCLTLTCGPDCAGLIPGLGGLGGGGGGGGRGGGQIGMQPAQNEYNEERARMNRSNMCELLEPWPELSCSENR